MLLFVPPHAAQRACGYAAHEDVLCAGRCSGCRSATRAAGPFKMHGRDVMRVNQHRNAITPAAGSSFSLQVTAAIPCSPSASPSKNSRLHASLRFVAVVDGN